MLSSSLVKFHKRIVHPTFREYRKLLESTMEELKNRSAYSKAMMPDGVAVLEGITKTCPNCKAIAPAVEKMMKKFPDVRWYHYDVDEAEDIAQELGSNAVPHFTIFNDGMKDDSVTGAKPRELERAIKACYSGMVVEDES